MKIRTKLTLFLIAYIIVWMIAMTGIFTGIAMRGFNILEKQSFETNIKRLDAAFDDMIRKSEPLLADWTEWDDSYKYILSQNDAFIKSNMSGSFMKEQGLDFVLFYGANDKVINTFQLQNGNYKDFPAPEVANTIIKYPDQSGLMLYNGRPVVFSSSRVTTTDGLAVPQGLMACAYYVEADDIREIADKLELDVRLISTHEIFNESINRIDVYNHKSYMTALFRIPYVNEDYSLALQLTHPLNITELGHQTMRDVLFASFAAFLLISVLLYFYVRKFALRISRVSDDVTKISHSGDLSLRLERNSNDEVSILIDDVNHMLDQIEDMNQKLAVHASIDMMTGVFNRRVGFEKLEEQIAVYGSAIHALTICYIDINNLKIVNDTMGHIFGDDLIQTIADALGAGVSERDIVCRIGGDEFLIVFAESNLEQAEYTMQQIETHLAEINKTKPYTISISKGLMEYDGTLDAHTFIEKADQYMYENKYTLKQALKQAGK